MSLLLATAAVLCAPAAAADPAAPTDYRATVRAIEPPVAGLEVRVVGGDAFLWLHNGTGRQIDVNGYEGEPYLRFLPDGVVEENQASPTTFINRDRLPNATAAQVPTSGAAPPANQVGPALAPEVRWKRVATDGGYAWHDHRAHWMSPIPPLGRQPGEEILDATVPIEVSGERVEVRVSVVWEHRPGVLLPLAFGLGTLGALAACWRIAGPARAALVSLGAAASLAAVASGWERASLPGPAAGSALRLVAPALAVLCVLAAWRSSRWRGALALLAALQLLGWGWSRHPAIYRAVLPTDAPFWLDRCATVAALVVGAVVAVWAGVAVWAAAAVAQSPRRDGSAGGLSAVTVRPEESATG